MTRNTICEDCWQPFATDYTNVKLCWDCERLRIIRKHPAAALQDKNLLRYARDNGIVIMRTAHGIEVKEVFGYEDDDAQWRSDLNKIKKRYRLKYGQHPSHEWAFSMAARAATRRAASKFPSKRLDIIKRKQVETNEDGEIIKPDREADQKPERQDEDRRQGGQPVLVQHSH